MTKKITQKSLSFLLSLVLIFTMLPMTVFATEPQDEAFYIEETSDEQSTNADTSVSEIEPDDFDINTALTQTSNGVVLDTNPAGGYAGDYVLIYNDSTDTGTPQSSGRLGNLLDEPVNFDLKDTQPKGPVKIDYHPEIPTKPLIPAELPSSQPDEENEIPVIDELIPETATDSTIKIKEFTSVEEPTNATYAVGSTKNFWINLYDDGYIYNLQFKLMKSGTNCYVWSLDDSRVQTTTKKITSAMATQMASFFDSNYSQMTNNFGTPYKPQGSNGKTNILCYDIEMDGFNGTTVTGYIAGFFWGRDFFTSAELGGEPANGELMLHIDTYPSVFWDGSSDISNAKSTLMHEFQHLLNFSQYMQNPSPSSTSMAAWLNEAMSMAAEELILPSSGLNTRVNEYNASAEILYGLSIYDFDLSYYNYALSSTFAQYLRAQTMQNGNTKDYSVFKRISQYYRTNANPTEKGAIEYAVKGTPLAGKTMEEIVTSYRIACAVNSKSGLYGFNNYGPTNKVKTNVYSDGGTINLYGGGAILIKPANKVFNPSGYGSNIKFVGISVSTVPLATGITLRNITGNIAGKMLTLGLKGNASNGETTKVTAAATPANASQVLKWTTSNAKVATVDSNGNITAIGKGSAKITVTTTDGSNKSAYVDIKVIQYATGITITAPSTSVYANKTLQLTAKFSNVPDNKGIVWSTKSSAYITVSNTGLVTGKPVSAKTRVSVVAKSADGNCSKEFFFYVVPTITTINIFDGATNVSGKTVNVPIVGTKATKQLTVKLAPTTNDGVTWKSSNASIATVSPSGLVTALKPGTVKITVTANDIGKKSQVVTLSIVKPVTSLTITAPTTMSKDKNGIYIALANKSYAFKSVLNPSNATNKKVEWSVSNPSIATISATGSLRTLKSGIVTVTVKSLDGSGKKASVKVQVYSPVTSVKINNIPQGMAVKEKCKLTATISSVDGKHFSGVTWKSSNTKVATVDANGNVTAVGVGTARITATSVDGSRKNSTATIKVVQRVTNLSYTVPANFVSANGRLYTAVGTKGVFKTTVTPSNATVKTLSWTSSNPNVAAVDTRGNVTAKAPGDCVITVKTTDGGKVVKTIKLTVKKAIPAINVGATTVTLPKSSKNPKPTYTINATVPNDTLISVLPKSSVLSFASSNTKIATVDANGKVTAVGLGTARITVSANDGSRKKATVTIKVVQQVESITLTAPAKGYTKLGDTYYASAGTRGAFKATLSPANATIKTLKWTSSNANVATVDARGNVVAKAPGNCVITATSTDGGNIKRSFKVKVCAPINSIDLGAKEATVKLSQRTYQIKTTVSPSNTINAYMKGISYKSSNASIASVDANGKVTVHKAGRVTITVTANDNSRKTARITINVVK